jgi:hypothetical protein
MTLGDAPVEAAPRPSWKIAGLAAAIMVVLGQVSGGWSLQAVS